MGAPLRWLLRLLRRRSLDRDLERELASHLDFLTEAGIRRGLAPAEARRRARLELGGIAQVREASRDARGTRWVEDWLRDARLTLRGFRREPGFAAAAVLTLAIGIGANTAVWNVLHSVLIRPLPIPRSEELHVLRSAGPSDRDPDYLFSWPKLVRFRARLADSIPIGAMSSVERQYLSTGGSPEPVQVQLVSGNWFTLLGVGASRGRVFGPSDENASAPPAAVLSAGYWERAFGRDPGIVGKPVRLNGAMVTIAGVAEPDFQGLIVGDPVDVWAPLPLQSLLRFRGSAFSTNSDTEQPWMPQNGINWLTLAVRVPSGAFRSLEAALAPLHRSDLEEEAAQRDSTERARVLRQTLALEPLSRGFSTIRQQFGDPIKVLMGCVGLVLLIACANLASLLLARSAAREQEHAIRASVGARAGRLFRQAMTESLVLGLAGGLMSLPVAWWGGLGLLRAASATSRPISLALAFDARVFGVVLALSIATGLLVGLVPALRIARAQPFGAAGTGRYTARALHRLPLGRVLVVAQIALSLALITGAGLFVGTLRNYLEITPGYESERILEARVDARAAGYEYPELPALHQRLLEATGAVPGVRAVGLAMNGLATGAARISGFRVPGVTRPPDWDNNARENFVSPGWFGAVGMTILRGREFSSADRSDGPQVAVVSQAFANHFFGSEDVVGRHFGYGRPTMEIVGVVRDARVSALKVPPKPLVFYPLAQGPQEYIQSIEVRTAGPPGPLARALREAIGRSEPRLPVREVVPVADLLQRSLSREKLLARLAGVFSAMALLLAGIGLYGVLAYSVSRRTNEIGVRMALGARPRSVWRMVIGDSAMVVASGIALGFGVWLSLQSTFRRLLYGLSPYDPATLLFATGVLAVTAFLAAWFPAWRAARVDPARALRNQ